MRIVVYGLGIIGASVCASLKAAGYTVYGKNRGRDAIEYALSHEMIDGEAQGYEGADVVFLALPPDVTMRELREGEFPPGCIVADICGVKLPLERAVKEKPRAYRYVGTHPMAGKETSGIRSASATLFRGANFVVTSNEETDCAARDAIVALAKDMGFGRIVSCSAAEHDRMIALTSQLAHIVSNAYIKSPSSRGCAGFTGGSFQDMTRVATLDEEIWTQLFLLNDRALLAELDGLIGRLTAYRDALSCADEGELKRLLHEGRLAHSEFLTLNRV